jgi:3-dehydroquinate synthase
MKTLNVGLRERAYPIHIGQGLLPRAGELLDLRAGSRAVIVTIAVVAAHHLPPL